MAGAGVAAAVAVASVTNREMLRGPETNGIQRTTFPNGLTIVSEFMPSVRSVALGAWVRSASVHEPRSLMGVSHMLEHLVFKGTKHRNARDLALALERYGGSLDAWTSREHTAFQARVLDEQLGIAAEVIGDLIFSPLLTEADLNLERRVVLEEIAMVEDDPADLVFELHNELLWDSHPLGYSILGTRESLAQMRIDDLRALHRRSYTADNIVVSAAGHVEHDELLDALRASGWDEAPAASQVQRQIVKPCFDAPKAHHRERDSAQTHIVLGGPCMGYDDERRDILALATVILGGGMSSILFQKIREELGLAYSIHSFHNFWAESGMHGVYAATGANEAGRALDAIRSELEAAARGGIPADDFEAGKGLLKGQLTLSLESPSSRLYRAAATELYGEPFRMLDEVLARIDAIGRDDVAVVAREYLHPDRLTVQTLGPGSLVH
ncbi:MAG: M16 family metallopeptidase [Gemmatimonadota bacterium]